MVTQKCLAVKKALPSQGKKVKLGNLKMKYKVSTSSSRSYPNVDAILAMTYPFGYYLSIDRASEGFKMYRRSMQWLGLHALFEPEDVKNRRVPMKNLSQTELQAQAAAQAAAEAAIKKYPRFSEDFLARLAKCMPYLGSTMMVKRINLERYKHAPLIKFVTEATYPEIAVSIFEKYNFGDLLPFVFREITKGSTQFFKFSYYKEEWVGIYLRDLVHISKQFPHCCEDGPDRQSKLMFRLMESKLEEDQYFLYEVHAGVNKDHELERCGPDGCIVGRSKDEATPPESIVLLYWSFPY